MSVLNNFVKHFIIFISYMLITSPVWADDELIQREQAAEKVAQQFVEQLSTQLKNEMKTQGATSVRCAGREWP